MKKYAFALALMMALCMLLSTAFAADAAILSNDDEDNWISASAYAVAGDTLYLAVDSSEGTALYYWKENMPHAEIAADGMFFAAYYSSLEEAETVAKARGEELGIELDPQHAVSLLFGWGDRLMGMNGYTGGLFEIKAENGRLTYADTVTMSDTSLLFHKEEDYSYLVYCSQYAVTGDTLLCLVEDYDQEGWQRNRLLSIDLTTGETAQVDVEHISRLTPWHDGKALLLCRDEQNAYNSDTGEWLKPDALVYDPATGKAEKIGQFPKENIPYLTYSAKLGALVYAENCRIMAMEDLTGEVQVGYIPQTWANNTAVLGDTYLLCSGEVMGRTISKGFRTDVSLTVYNDYIDEGTLAFTSQYPQVPVYTYDEYYGSMEEISQAMVSGDTTLDVLRMSSNYESFFRLMDKGYCADLSGNAELMAYAQRLQPAFRDVLMKDGKLYALPLHAYSYDGWYVANGVMEEMGLTMEDLPTNLVELCAFATRWNDEWVEEYPQFTLIEYCEDYTQQIFYYMLEGYTNYCTAKGQELRFNTPEFRAMMAALESMRADDLEKGVSVANEDEVGYRQGLFMPSYTVVGDFGGDSAYRTFVPMTLTADTDFFTGVNLEVMFINPRCENMEEAMNLLLCKIRAIDNSDRGSSARAYTLFADKTEPVENPYYQRNIESIEEYIARMEEDLADVPEEEKKDFQMMIDSEKQYLEQFRETQRWQISAEDIRRYQEEIVPCMVVLRPTFLSGSEDGAAEELGTLIQRYMDGQIKLEQFIRDADNKLMMMQLEDQ